MKIRKYITIASCLLFTSCGMTKEVNATPTKKETPTEQHGRASWYSIRTNGGTKTASGRKLSDHASTAAHKTLPIGTKVRVTNKNNGKSEVVVITDRGPYIHGRIIDVTIGTAKRLGFVNQGIAPVKVEVLKSANI
jgi:rare lipoprotein A